MGVGPVHEALAALELVDHHCHGVVTDALDRPVFESLLTEADVWPGSGISPFDTPVGIAVRRHCAPLLDLERHAPADEYLARRAELGPHEVNRRFLAAARTNVFCVDTGFAPHRIMTPAELAAPPRARWPMRSYGWRRSRSPWPRAGSSRTGTRTRSGRPCWTRCGGRGWWR